MKRQEILSRLGFTVPDCKKKRVIVHTDIACEADDPFAIVHHLLTPSEDVVGIIAAHYEYYYRTNEVHAASLPKDKQEEFYHTRLHTTELSYQLGQQILEKMEIDDVSLMKGAKDAILDPQHLPESEGADFIIKEALRDCSEPLYIALQGTLTDLAIAYLKEPKIAEHIKAAIWIGGGPYPNGCPEFNLMQDVTAAQIIFASDIPLWQYPMNAYASMNISLSEIMQKVYRKGEIGQFIAQYMLDFNEWMGKNSPYPGFPHGEVWSIGDNPTVMALLENEGGQRFHMAKAPLIGDDMLYNENPDGREIRVYDVVDQRLCMDDLFAKLDLCYGN